MASYTTANASVGDLKLKKPKYWPSTLYTCGIGGNLQVPFGLFFQKEDSIQLDPPIYPTLSLTLRAPLLEFRKGFMHAGFNAEYKNTHISLPKAKLDLKEDHIQLCPSLGMTLLDNGYFYGLISIWLGYEFNVIFNSQFTKDGVIDKEWPSMAFTQGLAFGTQTEFFYGIYFGSTLVMPFEIPGEHLIKLINNDSDSKGTKTIAVKEAIGKVSRFLTQNVYKVTIGVNLWSILHPPRMDEKGTNTANPETAAIDEQEI